MKPLTLNLSKMKKISGDKKISTFQHEDGHKITILHSALPALQQKQLQALPVHKMAEGGEVTETTLSEVGKQRPTQGAPQGETDTTLSEVGAQRPTPRPQPPAGTNNKLKQSRESNPVPAAQKLAEGSADVKPTPAPPPPNLPGVDSAQKSMRDAFHFAEGTDSVPTPQDTSQIEQQDQAVMNQPSQSAPKPAGEMPNITPNSIYNTSMSGVQAGQQAQEQQAQGDLQAYKASDADLMRIHQENQQGAMQIAQNIDSATKDIAANHINPQHYQESMGSGKKIGTAIGLLLGGISQGNSGGANPALEFLNKQIDRDVEAQRSNMENKKTLLGAYQQQFNNMQSAEAVTKATLLQHQANLINQAAAKAGTPLAKANALNATAQIQQKIFPLIMQAQLMQVKAAPPKSDGVDFEKMNRLQMLGVPKEDMEAATKEAQGYANHARQVPIVMNSFDKAASENTVGNRVAHAGFQPQSVGNFKASILPYLKDAEGRINEQELQRTDAFAPSPGDSEYKTAEKRKGVADFLREKNSPETFPTLSRYNLVSHKEQPQLSTTDHQAIIWAKQHPGPKADIILNAHKGN